jgi:hypothetical protein
MALNQMPAIDQNTCGDWTENDRNLYQAMPFYLAKVQVEMKKTFPTFSKLTKTRKWKANNGPTLRGVVTNPSPRIRQFANPRTIAQQALTDIMNIREHTMEATVKHQKFESPIFNWYPEFNDFLSHIDDNGKDIMQKQEIFNEVFLRGMMFHMCPWVFICNADGSVTLKEAPFFTGTGQLAAGDGKTAAFLTANLPTGGLRASAINMAMTIMETDLRIPFFKGSELPKEDQALDGKFLLINNSESWNQFAFDPAVRAGAPIDMNFINNGFRGSFWGRSVSRIEDTPLRYDADGTFWEPELSAAEDEYNEGETLPNPKYAGIIDGSPYAVAWLSGSPGYESIEVGPPPSMFARDEFPNAPKMDWSGQVRLTKNFVIQCVDADGNVHIEANTYGEHLKFISKLTCGILPTQRRNTIPILYKRERNVQIAA